MMPEVHNLPPENKAHEKPSRWENNDAQDKRGIREVWLTLKRLADRGVELAENVESKAADLSAWADRMAERGVEPEVSRDARFPKGYPHKLDAE